MAQSAAWWAKFCSALHTMQDLGSHLMTDDLPWPPYFYIGLDMQHLCASDLAVLS